MYACRGAIETEGICDLGPDDKLAGELAILALALSNSPISFVASLQAGDSEMTDNPNAGFSFSFSLLASHHSTSFVLSSSAQNRSIVQFCSRSKRRAIASRLQGNSRVP
jgi:hypothetical protein